MVHYVELNLWRLIKKSVAQYFKLKIYRADLKYCQQPSLIPDLHIITDFLLTISYKTYWGLFCMELSEFRE